MMKTKFNEVNKMDVIFRHKNKDDVIMAFNIQENKLYDDMINDSNAVYLDMYDDDIRKVMLALCELRGSKTFNIEKYINALNDILGVDHAYFSGDEKVDALVELIVMAKNLAEENELLKAQLEPFKEKRCFTCLHRNVGQDHMPCYECENYKNYEWLGGRDL